MAKSYSDFINEISKDEIYEGLLAHGLFADTLPPVFSSESFYDYCLGMNHSFNDIEGNYVYYESMRNTNVPRQIAIPNPMSYQKLCKFISDNWDKLQKHFQEKTENQKYIVSRVHVRKMNNTKKIFKMNYKKWESDGSPESELLIGKKYIVQADISTCFPSIYTHSLSWALIGKENAKHKRNGNSWFNRLDKLTSYCKNGETHGLIIGPHTSNLLSEIILTTIDNELNDWEYTRNIDDYTCYVETHEKAQEFLIRLADELRKFDLILNHKKTKIIELPIAITKQWVRKFDNISTFFRKGKFDYKSAQAYFDNAIEMMKDNEDNSAILNYAIKSLPYENMSENAKEYCVKIVSHLCLLYPYLLKVIDEYIFERFNVPIEEIKDFANLVYEQELKNKNYDGVCFAIFFALKYDFTIDSNYINANEAENSNSCIFRLLALLYFAKHSIKSEKKALIDLASKIKTNNDDFGNNWIFVYEALSQNKFSDEWKALKKNKISFLKEEYQILKNKQGKAKNAVS